MPEIIGSLIISVKGKTLTQEEREWLIHPLIGGVILFARNYENRTQLRQLCRDIRSIKSTLLIMADQEGGRVQRFIDGFTRLPPMGEFGKFFDRQPQQACQMAQDCGWLMASELLVCGIDLSLAPVLDLNTNVSQVIGNRAFHHDPNTVFQLAKAFIKGMSQAGMAATGKHFPGHGCVAIDSHFATPIDARLYSSLEAQDMQPFIAFAREGIPALMMAHIIFSEIDKVQVSFSGYWLKDILRKKIGYKGVIFSDDLNMEGANISTNYAYRVGMARDAGCDFILLCNNQNGIIQALNELPYDKHQVSVEKWRSLRGNFNQASPALEKSPHWQQIQKKLLQMTN